MQQHRDVPAALINLDNRDGHLSQLPDAPKHESFPHTYVLIEGHNRFEIAAALFKKGDFARQVPVWLMEVVRGE